jgi:hypothetical protein
MELTSLFKLDDNTFIEEKKSVDDGIYRVRLEKVVDKNKTYKARVRFLPYLLPDGSALGRTFLEKHIHYAKLEERSDLRGYYDCLKDIPGEKCPLCDAFWALKNTKNAANEAKAELISRSTKYYAYVLIEEDIQQPELVGRVMIFPFGYKIMQKILVQKDERNVRVEDIVNGKSFFLSVKEFGGFPNYDSSEFDAISPLSIEGTPVKADANGTLMSADAAKVFELLKSRTKELSDYASKPWTAEQRTKVDNIIAYLTGASTTNDMSYNQAPSASIDDVLSGNDIGGFTAVPGVDQSDLDDATDYFS